MTAGPAVYRLYDRDGQVLYIGMTGVSARKRIGQHLQKPWGEAVARAVITPYGSRASAARAEYDAIRAEKPRWNVDRCMTFRERAEQWSEDDWRVWLAALRAAKVGDAIYAAAVSEFRAVHGRARTFKPVGRPARYRLQEFVEIAEYDPMESVDATA